MKGPLGLLLKPGPILTSFITGPQFAHPIWDTKKSNSEQRVRIGLQGMVPMSTWSKASLLTLVDKIHLYFKSDTLEANLLKTKLEI